MSDSECGRRSRGVPCWRALRRGIAGLDDLEFSSWRPCWIGNAGERPGCARCLVFVEKGGGGVLLGANPSYVVDGVGVERWLPGVICALLRHFWRRFGEGRAAAEEPKERTGLAFVVSHPCLKNKGTARMGHPANAKERTGLAFVVSHPCLRNKGTARMGHPAFVVSHPCLRNKGTARMGHPAFPAASSNFRIFSCMAFALQRTTSIVRFWGLIACRIGQLILARLVVCFVGFSGWSENWRA